MCAKLPRELQDIIYKHACVEHEVIWIKHWEIKSRRPKSGELSARSDSDFEDADLWYNEHRATDNESVHSVLHRDPDYDIDDTYMFPDAKE
jgi:hypothetical protein